MRDTFDMAREVGIEFQRNRGPLGRESISTAGSQSLEKIERLVELARADEREACAKVADEYANGLERNYSENIADAIRARGETK
jgi:predicted solute-binding protein